MIEFNIAGEGGSIGKRFGKLITLKVGKEHVNLVIQQPEGYLTHFETGWALRTYGDRITSKASAIKLWKEIIEKHGVDYVLERINSNPIINQIEAVS